MGWVMLATLLLFGLGAKGPQQEERPLSRSYHGAAVVNGKIYLLGGPDADGGVREVQEMLPPAVAR